MPIFSEKELKQVWKKLRKLENVVGMDNEFHPRIKNGQEIPGTKVLRVYVKKKVPETELKLRDIIPKKIEGIETDVVEIGEVRALSENPQQKYRPVVAGTSGCHVDCTACTISGFFRDQKTGQVYIALNNHCGALENKAKKGDAWIQPSPYDGGTVADKIAELHHFVEVKFNEFECKYRNALHKIYRFFKRDIPFNKVDIAFGVPVVDFKVECLNIPNAFKGYRDPVVGEKVQKMGRTTGLTTDGEVVSTSWTGTVMYSRGVATFTDCILIHKQGFSAGGDSGSPIFDMNGNLVGILFAGSDEYTIACKIPNIMVEGGVIPVLFPDKSMEIRQEGKLIEERDKPFILALISAGITVGSIIAACAGAVLGNNQLTSIAMEVLKFTFPLTTMAWTFYLKKD